MNPTPDQYLLPALVQMVLLMINHSFIFAEALLLSVHLFGRDHKLRKLDLIWGPIPFFLTGPVIFIGAVIYGFYTGYTNPDSPDLDYNTIADSLMKLPVLEIISVAYEFGFFVYAFFISLLLFRKEKMKSAMINALIFYSLSIIANDCITDFGVMLSRDPRYMMAKFLDIKTTSQNLMFFVNLASTALVITVYVLSRARLVKRGKKYDMAPKYASIICLSVILIHYVISIPFLSVFTDTQSDWISRILLAVFIPLLTMLIPVLSFVFLHRQKLRDQSLSQADYLEAELEYINGYKKREDATRRFRLETADKLTYIDSLFEKGDISSAEKKIEEMLGGIRALSPKFVTGDEMLDLIVSMKAAVMDEAGIQFNYDGVIDGGLNMKPFDVCGIFANALDNAIEACRSAGSGKALKIAMNITRTPAFFLIKISNSCRPDVDASRLFVDGEVYTSKKDRSLHGIGTQNIKNAVESYGGMVKAKAENSVFELSITLPRD